MEINWSDEFKGEITICDRNGIIVYMNQYAIRQFEKYGGAKLMGTNLIDCHPEPSKSKLIEMLQNPIENSYINEKNGQQKIVLQTPWMQEGEFCGVIEISFELPDSMPVKKK